jgi:hypothetical protein
MNKIYLIAEHGREDSYNFVGRSEDLQKLFEDDPSVVVGYPGSDKEVCVSFTLSNNPESNSIVKKDATKNKRKEWIGTLLFILLPILAIWGTVQLIRTLMTWF